LTRVRNSFIEKKIRESMKHRVVRNRKRERENEGKKKLNKKVSEE
jgi:hypothetical protein